MWIRIAIILLCGSFALAQTHTLNLEWDDPNTADDQVVSFIMEESVQRFMQSQQQTNTAIIESMKNPDEEVQEFVN